MNTSEARLLRTFPHPVSLVYEMWTEPAHMAEWFRPFDDVTLQIERFDFRENGEYFFRYTWPAGVFPVGGKFFTIISEKTLIFSWDPQPPDIDAGKQTLVSVWFREIGENTTELEIRHTLFPDPVMRQRHEDGWSATIERLSRYLLKQKNQQPQNT